MGTEELKAAALAQGDREGTFTDDMQNNNPPREKLKKRDSNWLFHEAAGSLDSLIVSLLDYNASF